MLSGGHPQTPGSAQSLHPVVPAPRGGPYFGSNDDSAINQSQVPKAVRALHKAFELEEG